MTNKSLENALAFLHSAVSHLRAPHLIQDPSAQSALNCVSAAYVAVEEADAFNKMNLFSGVMGEADAEAILPLKRTDGKLGVKKEQK